MKVNKGHYDGRDMLFLPERDGGLGWRIEVFEKKKTQHENGGL